MSPQIIRPLLSKHVDNEQPTGLVDGANTGFATAFKFENSTLKVYLNGLKLSPGIGNDYTVSDNQNFVMNYPPETGDVIVVDYLRQYTTV